MISVEDLRAMHVDWHDMPVITFLSGELDKEGDLVVGLLVAYNPTFGAQNYERTRDVGVLILQTAPGGWLKIGLDKGMLATAVHNALSGGSVVRGSLVAIQFTDWSETGRKGHKRYKVRTGTVGAIASDHFGILL